MLCLVISYLLPGFPRPAISFTAVLLGKEGTHGVVVKGSMDGLGENFGHG